MTNYKKPILTKATVDYLEVINASSAGNGNNIVPETSACPYGYTQINRHACLGKNEVTGEINSCINFIGGRDVMDLRYAKCQKGVPAPVW